MFGARLVLVENVVLNISSTSVTCAQREPDFDFSQLEDIDGQVVPCEGMLGFFADLSLKADNFI